MKSSDSRPANTGTAQPLRVISSSSPTSTTRLPPSSTAVTGERPPASTWATAAPVAPVPLADVSPTPRSKIRTRIVCASLAENHDTFVRLGNSWSFQHIQVGNPQCLIVRHGDRALRIADLDVLKAP